MRKIAILAILLSITPFMLKAQDLGGGFKVGLNSSTLLGDSEVDAAGNSLESFGYLTGFHVGGLVQVKFTNRFGVQAELLFSQRGTDYRYEGEGFQTYVASNNAIFNTTGNRRIIMNITNGYINIPVMAYFNLKNLAISAGPYMDILVSSTAIGETTYIGVTSNGSDVIDPNNINNANPDNDNLILTTYEFNYIRDDAGASVGNDGTRNILVGSEDISIPRTEGAYYNYDTKDGNYFNPLDFGVHGSIGWRFSNGLRFDLRANYGLTDITNNFYDVALSEHNNFEPVARTDKDTNLTFALSIGFGF